MCIRDSVRYGNLVINKELVDHNATFGNNATFVFQIDITTLDNKKETRIEELTFDAAGSHSVTIEKIPAGSHVTVTAVSYTHLDVSKRQSYNYTKFKRT